MLKESNNAFVFLIEKGKQKKTSQTPLGSKTSQSMHLHFL